MKPIQNKYQCIPQNDMDCYYNTVWKKLQKVSGTEETISNFSILEKRIDRELYRFIGTATKDQNDPVLNNMIEFRNSYYRRNEGFGPMIQLVDEIQNIANVDHLAKTVAKLISINVPTLFAFRVEPHFKEPDNYWIGIGDISLTLGPNTVYDDIDKELWTDYLNMLQSVHNFLQNNWGYRQSNLLTFSENISILEILFSRTAFTPMEARDPLLVYRSDSYQTFMDKFDSENFWRTILDQYTPKNSYIIYENDQSLNLIKKLISNLNPQILTMIKDYMIFCLAREYGICTTYLFKAFGNVMLGHISERQFFLELFYLTFGPYLQTVYEKKYRDLDKIKYTNDMFQRMKAYCTSVIVRSDIFSNETKIEALAKIKTLDIIIGTQKYSVNLTELPPLNSNFYQNLIIIHNFYFNIMIKMVGKPVDRYTLSIVNDLYSFSVNAYYEPFSNLIYLPTAMLDDMFLKVDRDPIYNYGSIGTVIGHEMMHCFDTFGALFDYRGHLKNWWSQRDYAKYRADIAKVENHYRTILLYDTPINHRSSIGEDIADITGIKISFRTYLTTYFPDISINTLTKPQKEYLKKFFETWTQTLRIVEDPDTVKQEILFGQHSPNIIRTNAPFAHLDEYYQIYDVKPEHLNYLEPNERSRFID